MTITNPSLNGRDTKTGKFVKGWKGGPGNPFSKISNKLRSAVMRTLTEQDMVEITQVAIHHAKLNDHKAREWLSKYSIGLPTQHINLNHKDTQLHVVETLVDAPPSQN